MHAESLPAAHKAFHDRISAFIPAERMFLGPFRSLALGDDASFYRLIPKIVVKAVTEAEVARILRAAVEHVAVTFSTAGVSLSGNRRPVAFASSPGGAFHGIVS